MIASTFYIDVGKLNRIESIIKTKGKRERNSSINDLVADRYIDYLVQVLNYYLVEEVDQLINLGGGEGGATYSFQVALNCLCAISHISSSACSELVNCKIIQTLQYLLEIDSKTHQQRFTSQVIDCLLVIGESGGSYHVTKVIDYLLNRMVQEEVGSGGGGGSSPSSPSPSPPHVTSCSLKFISTLYNIEEYYYRQGGSNGAHFINVIRVVKGFLSSQHLGVRTESKRSLARLLKHYHSLTTLYNHNGIHQLSQSISTVLLANENNIFQLLCKQCTMLLDLETLDLFISIWKMNNNQIEINNNNNNSNSEIQTILIIKAIINTAMRHSSLQKMTDVNNNNYNNNNNNIGLENQSILLRCFESLGIMMESNSKHVDMLINIDRLDYQFLDQLLPTFDKMIISNASNPNLLIDYTTRQLIILQLFCHG
ncbi:hypothetical protein DFA_05661 [Cavenderia fasciculata]|uniref:Armadillo-like helical domain-containing protein n=1 Tax=Cavenderia fasciculata TaxID=261658 RepID=F4PLX4_CACFS|nr:uncharacterized protein DFA_05661 [Cavenderia fasciculata]EGG23528.1 hypothetical protein DFA_05661 [Cavenderia fasciculata]|eukprot:XP_004361379.1 hypothetical protein DFA_05661 [Cavenderia fasciculata]